ncbi:MAG: integrase [Magnetococcales bacterium]|nr:integrase [Magnetococcales bacterium]
MTTMISEVYTALIEAGAPKVSARKAAEALSQEPLATKVDVVRIEKELAIIKWMLALVVAAEVLPILRETVMHG